MLKWFKIKRVSLAMRSIAWMWATCLLEWRVVSYQVEVSAHGLSLLQRSTSDWECPSITVKPQYRGAWADHGCFYTMQMTQKYFTRSSLLQPQVNRSFYAALRPPHIFRHKRARVGVAELYYCKSYCISRD
jgi:hypothetical protein